MIIQYFRCTRAPFYIYIKKHSCIKTSRKLNFYAFYYIFNTLNLLTYYTWRHSPLHKNSIKSKTFFFFTALPLSFHSMNLFLQSHLQKQKEKALWDKYHHSNVSCTKAPKSNTGPLVFNIIKTSVWKFNNLSGLFSRFRVHGSLSPIGTNSLTSSLDNICHNWL